MENKKINTCNKTSNEVLSSEITLSTCNDTSLSLKHKSILKQSAISKRNF